MSWTVKQIRADGAYADAVCEKDKGLCSFIPSNRSDSQHLVEICKLCGKRVGFCLVDGELGDVRGYSNAHIRDLLQPGMQAYEEVYGSSWRQRKGRKQDERTPEQRHKDLVDEARDTARTLSRMEAQGRLDQA